ncbi:U2 snRNP-associated SURP motif-containing protein [Smittium mucronatum]|uniref:U2 snRNP-associated SURP motif-containing protein n=1 Tax=Smittium mucronatum TaxID=133383 RepID=A0A1R0GT56_9FUNG|nr:U2 snRNP-associated SURP motif-containing protein [Smittium mucronatum]
MQKRKTLKAFNLTSKKPIGMFKKLNEENKKKIEAEETAKVFEEFVAVFDIEENNSKAFVRAGTEQDGAIKNQEREIYKPKIVTEVAGTDSKISSANEENPTGLTESNIQGSKKRNLDSFLEEIKRQQSEREERLKLKKMSTDGDTSKGLTVMAAFEDSPGSHEVGDDTTTNLYVGNLYPQINEEILLEHFGKFGPIGSVKIMWPRKKDELDRGHLSGFVSFMDRESAAAALKEMDGFNLKGFEMRVDSWKSEMFYMYNEGPIWVPPEVPIDSSEVPDLSNSSEDEEIERKRAPKNVLGKVATFRLFKRLKNMGVDRGSISKSMAFVLEHADAAEQISQTILKYHFNAGFDHQTLLARLFLVSDILHNCSAQVSNAWRYRQCFEKILPEMFLILVESYRAITSRIKAEHFRVKVLNVLALWEYWLVFSSDFIHSLASGFFIKKVEAS